MKLELYRDNLQSKYKNLNCGQTEFEHFDKSTKKAIIIVGKATFYEYDRSNYNAIYPPMKRDENDS